MDEEKKAFPIHWFALAAYLLSGLALVLAADSRTRIAREAERNAECYVEAKQYADQLSACYVERAATREEMKAMWYYILAKTGSSGSIE